MTRTLHLVIAEISWSRSIACLIRYRCKESNTALSAPCIARECASSEKTKKILKQTYAKYSAFRLSPKAKNPVVLEVYRIFEIFSVPFQVMMTATMTVEARNLSEKEPQEFNLN